MKPPTHSRCPPLPHVLSPSAAPAGPRSFPAPRRIAHCQCDIAHRNAFRLTLLLPALVACTESSRGLQLHALPISIFSSPPQPTPLHAHLHTPFTPTIGLPSQSADLVTLTHLHALLAVESRTPARTPNTTHGHCKHPSPLSALLPPLLPPSPDTFLCPPFRSTTPAPTPYAPSGWAAASLSWSSCSQRWCCWSTSTSSPL